MMKLLVVLLALLLTLSACGFSPIYSGKGSSAPPVAKALNNIYIANIADRDGQFLRNHLIDRIYGTGRPANPTMHLEITLSSNTRELGIQKDSTASRSELDQWANYELKDKDNNQLLKGQAHSLVSYSKLNAQYGTLAAQRNAKERALKEMGEEIVNRLSLYFAEPPASAKQIRATKSAPHRL